MNKGVEVKAIGPTLEIKLEQGLAIVAYVGGDEIAAALARGFHNEHLVDAFIDLIDFNLAQRNGRIS